MIEKYQQASAWTESVFAQATAAGDAATPCTEWDVHTLMNHIIGGNHMFAGAIRGAPAPEGEPPDLVGDDPVAAYRASVADLVAAASEDGAMERTCQLPIGEVPASMALAVAFFEQMVHGWDLATASGHSPEMPAGPFAALQEVVGGMPTEDFRGTAIGAEVEVGDDATDQERLLAFLGRPS